MKKILLFSVILLILLTGCENDKTDVSKPDIKNDIKRMVCTQKVQTVNVNMIVDYTGEELTYFGLKYEMDLSVYSDIQIQAIEKTDMCSTVKKTMDNYTNAFTNCKQTVENKVLLITADFDLDKINGADLSRETSISEAKAQLEKQNYTCVISDK